MHRRKKKILHFVLKTITKAAFVATRKEQSQKTDSMEDLNQIAGSASALLIKCDRAFRSNLTATQQLRINIPDSWFPNALAQ